MNRLINTLAMTALVITLGAGLWQDWGFFTTMKRMIFSYLGFFFLGSLLTLAVASVPLFENSATEEVDDSHDKNKSNAA